MCRICYNILCINLKTVVCVIKLIRKTAHANPTKKFCMMLENMKREEAVLGLPSPIGFFHLIW